MKVDQLWRILRLWLLSGGPTSSREVLLIKIACCNNFLTVATWASIILDQIPIGYTYNCIWTDSVNVVWMMIKMQLYLIELLQISNGYRYCLSPVCLSLRKLTTNEFGL